MKKLITSILIGASVFCIVYLLGAFVAVSFDITQWNEGGRVAVAVIGGVMALASIGSYHASMVEN